ncbi:LytTR family DNA-binding domain-containing protein [Persicobacter psychrovividus]|uniref:HTH LytTR-type domain-containing protein n=1 Tax=Persicobacter psychrovividus TaxID=387638 RepID=A0ABM7VI24_9BACT|nr:hypothetical protein PEPS_29130 [Persicobacter psychrovividus]
MKNQLLRSILYWSCILTFLTLFFGNQWASFELSFYFSAMLLPVVVATSYFFNHYLLPRYLLQAQYFRFGLYFIYMIIVSLYFEMLIALISFVILANYDIQNMGLQARSIFILSLNLYLIVFISSFIDLFIQYKKNTQEMAQLKAEIKKKEKGLLNIRANRQNIQLPYHQILYIESQDDYVKIATAESTFQSRERISAIAARLPKEFVRIHRSFLINKNNMASHTKSEVVIADQHLPIGRKFKAAALRQFLEHKP